MQSNCDIFILKIIMSEKQSAERLTSKGESQAGESHELSELPLPRGFVLCGLEV